MPTSTLEVLTHDPRNLESDKFIELHPHLAALARHREEIQRPFKGQKKANVPKYRDYLIQNHEKAQNGQYFGAVPTITLWTPENLEVREFEIAGTLGLKTHILSVPHGVKLIAIDGETQLAARYEGAGLLANHIARVTIHYGKPVEWAIGAFVDLNTRMVAMNRELTISKSVDDVLTEIAKDLSHSHALLYQQIKETDTTILQGEHYWMTLGKLRLFVACVWRGKPGVAIGSRPIHESDFKEDDASKARLREVCRSFWDVVKSDGQPLIKAFEHRRNTVIGTPAVIAALGAIAHECAGGKGLPLADDALQLVDSLKAAIQALGKVHWARNAAWSGPCGRLIERPNDPGAQPKFRVGGGAKDGIYDVFRALRDPTSENYKRVREFCHNGE
jgi:DNA sulfur modification protein DndB